MKEIFCEMLDKSNGTLTYNQLDVVREEAQKDILDKLGELLFLEKIDLIDENNEEVSYIWIKNKLKEK